MELQESTMKFRSLNQQTDLDDMTKKDHEKMRAVTREISEKGAMELKLGTEIGRANSGKTGWDGESLQDTDAGRVLVSLLFSYVRSSPKKDM